MSTENKSKTICFYLPQFYQFKENDEWWGEGFTEWTNVKKAKSLFKGHDQPKTPLNDNYYCLLDVDTIKWQASIAKQNNVYGFCFYQYYFGKGKFLMEKPIELFLERKDIDINFCLSWANHNWTKSWIGGEKEILMKVDYLGEQDYREYFIYLKDFFLDKRYIKHNNKPMFIIYMPEDIPDFDIFKKVFNEEAIKIGFDGVYFVSQEASCYLSKLNRKIVDNHIMYEPNFSFEVIQNYLRKGRLFTAYSHSIRLTNEILFNKMKKILCKFPILKSIKNISLQVYSYDVICKCILRKAKKYDLIPGALSGFDSTPRRGDKGIVFKNNTPKKFEKYFSKLLEISNSDYVFITAWNEWGEGAILEPDKKNGYGYLEGVKKAYEN